MRNIQLGRIHLLDTPKNRDIITNILGPSEFDFFSDGYIEYNDLLNQIIEARKDYKNQYK
jgi:hypothetical protein